MTRIGKSSSIIFLALVIGEPGILAAVPASGAAEGMEPRISLITILPGKALYSSFGHTAIRVLGPAAGSDILYNYGLSENPFDARFAARMLVGRMDFTVGALDAKAEFRFYRQRENRTIIEQRLDLDDGQKASLLSTLEKNSLPENRIYNYRYFTDNCATRVWKILKALDIEAPRARALPSRPTLRESIDRTLSKRPWLDFAIDLMLGPRADARVRSDAPIFLPVELMDWTAGIAKPGTQGEGKLVADTKVLYEAQPEKEPRTGITPLETAVALLVLAVALGLFLRRDHPAAIVFDAFLFGAAAMICLAMALFWLAAGYGEVGMNLSLMWANPLPLVALLCDRKRSRSRLSMLLFRIAAAAAALVAVLGGLGIQTIAPAIRIIALAVAIRCLTMASRTRVLELRLSRDSTQLRGRRPSSESGEKEWTMKE
jgi:hypothetical protein